MCKYRPCWGTPEELEKIIEAGFSNRLMMDYWAGGGKVLDKFSCEKNPSKEHKMYYEYTWLISWDTGFITNIVKCCYCGIEAQTSTMYETNALYSLELKFRQDTIHRRIIKGEIADSQNSV